jgi:hypothetical protein
MGGGADTGGSGLSARTDFLFSADVCVEYIRVLLFFALLGILDMYSLFCTMCSGWGFGFMFFNYGRRH